VRSFSRKDIPDDWVVTTSPRPRRSSRRAPPVTLERERELPAASTSATDEDTPKLELEDASEPPMEAIPPKPRRRLRSNAISAGSTSFQRSAAPSPELQAEPYSAHISHGAGSMRRASVPFPEFVMPDIQTTAEDKNTLEAPPKEAQPEKEKWTRSVRNSFTNSIKSAKEAVRSRRISLTALPVAPKETEKGEARSRGKSFGQSVKRFASKKPNFNLKTGKGKTKSKKDTSGAKEIGCVPTELEPQPSTEAKTERRGLPKRGTVVGLFDPPAGLEPAGLEPSGAEPAVAGPSGTTGMAAHADALAAEDAAYAAVGEEAQPEFSNDLCATEHYTDVFGAFAEYGNAMDRTDTTSTYQTAATKFMLDVVSASAEPGTARDIVATSAEPEPADAHHTSLDMSWTKEALEEALQGYEEELQVYEEEAAADGIDLDEIVVDLTLGTTTPLKFRTRVQNLTNAGLTRMTRTEYEDWERNGFHESVYGETGMDFSAKIPWTVYSPGKTIKKSAWPKKGKEASVTGNGLGAELDLSDVTYGNTPAFQARQVAQAAALPVRNTSPPRPPSPSTSEASRFFSPPSKSEDPATIRAPLRGQYHTTQTVDTPHAAYAMDKLCRPDVSVSTQSEEMDLEALGLTSPTAPTTPGQAYFVRGVMHSRPAPAPQPRLSSDPLNRRQPIGDRNVSDPAHRSLPSPPPPSPTSQRPLRT
jgi:hypothetical protein